MQQELGISVHSGVAYCHMVGPICHSPAEAYYAKAIGMQAISTGIAPEVLVARHVSLPSAAIAIVRASIAGQEPIELEDSKLPVDTVEKLLSKVVAQL